MILIAFYRNNVVNDLSRVITLCAAIALTGCAEENPQQFIKEGKSLVEKGDVESARVQFKNALQINPQLAEAYYGLALLDEKAKDFKSMRRNLLDTVRLDPKHVDAQVKLGFLQINEIEKAKEQVVIAFELAPEDNNAILLDGQIHLLDKDYEGALSRASRVLADDPLMVEAIWLEAYVFLEEKRYDDALASLARGLDVQPDNLELGLLKIKLYKAQKKYDEVNRTYEELVELHPEDKVLGYARLEVLARTAKEAEPVEKALRDALAKDPSDMTLKLTLVDMLERSNVDQAEKQLKEFIQDSPEDTTLKGRLAGLYIGYKKYSQAEELLKQIVDKDPIGKEGLIAKVRLSELSLQQKDKATAEKLLGEVLTVDNANSDALLLRSSLRLAAKDYDGAVSDLRIVLRDKPDSGQAMVGMGQAYSLKGEPEVAESHWRKALEVNPSNMGALMPLVAARMKRGDAERAEDLLVKAIKSNATNPVLTEMLVKVRVSKKDWAGAQAAVNELEKQPKNRLVAQMLTGMLLDTQGLYLKAIDVYKAVLLEKPDMGSALLAISRSYKVAKLPEEYIVFLKSYLEKNSGSIHVSNLLAQAYAAEKKWDQAEKVLQQTLKLEPKSTTAYRLLGAVLLSQGRSSDAEAVYQQGLGVMPDNPELMLALAKYFKEVKAYDEAIESYEKMLTKYPNADEAANDLADLLVSTSDDPVNLNRAKELVERFKDSQQPYALDTYGWVMYKTGGAEKAVPILEEAVLAVPDNAVIRYHLGEALYAVGDYSASKLELEKSLSLVKKNNEFEGIERARQLLKEIGESANG